MKKRTKDYYRYQRNKHIVRKKKMIQTGKVFWNIKYDGMLSKGKVHCSCWMCAFSGKTISDLRRENSMKYKEKECYH